MAGDPVQDQRVENPIKKLNHRQLNSFVTDLYSNEFRGKSSVTLTELLTSAAYARFFLNHEQAGTELSNSANVLDERGQIMGGPRTGKYLTSPEWKAYKTQADRRFWKDPKDLLVTMVACCLASFTQGWNQVANGNLGWPGEFNLNISSDGAGGNTGGTGDFWIVGGVTCITWFAAAILGPFLVDPVCQLRWAGRRGAVCLAALFSFASMIGGSRATSWQGYLVARLFLGIGIGAKASIVPIWECEILPSAKRGRLLVSWQFFTASGIFAGSIATYILRAHWRSQVLSGALPALLLLVVTCFGTESPRWLILHGRYDKAFEALHRLRGQRLLALEELCYIHFLIQAERSSLYPKPKLATLELGGRLPHLGYFHRLWRIPHIPRNKRAAIATMIVMLSQQLSGINILGFVSSIFFFTAALRPQSTPPSSSTSTPSPETLNNAYDSLRFSIGFGCANALFSALAYFLIEPLPTDDPMKGRFLPIEEKFQDNGTQKKDSPWKYEPGPRTRTCLKLVVGRRALLMCSLGGGSAMLLVLTFLLKLDAENGVKLPLVMLFIILWTLFYSPGAGCVPFLYSAEVWPNEGREVGMSWAVFWNFFGAGLLALFVPRGLKWGPSKLFGLFTGLSFFAMILVYLFVPSTDRVNSLEDMSEKFDVPYREFSKKRLEILMNPSRSGVKTASAPNQPVQTQVAHGIGQGGYGVGPNIRDGISGQGVENPANQTRGMQPLFVEEGDGGSEGEDSTRDEEAEQHVQMDVHAENRFGPK